MNRPHSQGGLAPLDVTIDGSPVGTVTPSALGWNLFEFQFSVALGTSSFNLQFSVNRINFADTSIFLDHVQLLSDAPCINCNTYTCTPGQYLSTTPCAGAGSCLTCLSGSYCLGYHNDTTPCPAGTYSYVGASSISDCLPCLNSCPPGYFNSTPLFGAGSYALCSTCQQCQPGSYCMLTVICLIHYFVLNCRSWFQCIVTVSS
jgi:hypothetical protein